MGSGRGSGIGSTPSDDYDDFKQSTAPHNFQPKVLSIGSAIEPIFLTLTSAPAVLCSVTPNLPIGLVSEIQDDLCVITGKPETLHPSTEYTVTVTAADGSSDTATIFIAVTDTEAPLVAVPTIELSSVTKNGLTLSWSPASDNHTSTNDLTYRVCYGTSSIEESTCAGASVARDFTKNLTSLVISDMNSNTLYHFRVFVQDSAENISFYDSGSQKTLPDPPVIKDQGLKNFLTTLTIEEFDFENSGPDIATCTIDQALPAGLTFNTESCAISGTPSTAQAATTYLVTATGHDGSSDSATVTIEVTAANPPVFNAPSAQNFVTTVPVSFSFVRSSGGNALSCTSSPSLPSGLNLAQNLNTCHISGTPDTPTAEQTYKITATAADGSKGAVDIKITVHAANPPALASIATPIELTVNISDEEIAFDNSGAEVVNCELSPALPHGLSFDEDTCTITGIPTSLQNETLYTVTATAADSSQDTATVMISVTLNCPTGYIPVNSYTDDDLGTVAAFCVMKYEAKNVGGIATSRPQGTPWVSIQRGANSSTSNSAWRACKSLTLTGYEFDLISNAQWQSLARQIERYESAPGYYVNWSNHSVADDNYINRGHADQNPADPQAASTDDNPCINSNAANCADPTHSDFLQKRTHTLPNGEVIWDLAGNVWEWVKDDSTFTYGSNSFIQAFTAEFGNACIAPSCSGPQGKPKAVFGPFGNYQEKTSAPFGGLGQGSIAFNDGAIRRGGDVAASNASGLFATHLNRGSNYSREVLGFRCVAVPVP